MWQPLICLVMIMSSFAYIKAEASHDLIDKEDPTKLKADKDEVADYLMGQVIRSLLKGDKMDTSDGKNELKDKGTTVQYECKYVTGQSLISKPIGSMSEQECTNTCLGEKESDNTIVGAVYITDKKQCRCGTDVVSVPDGPKFKSCVFKPKAKFGCKMRQGTAVGLGTKKIKISKQYHNIEQSECVRKCIELRRTFKPVNAVSYGDRTCTCSYRASAIKIKTGYNACILTEPLPAKGECKLNLNIPDAKGLIDSTSKSSEQCRKLCTDKKKDNSDINASVYSAFAQKCICAENAMSTTKLLYYKTCNLGSGSAVKEKKPEFLIESPTAIEKGKFVTKVTMEKEYTVTFDVFATALLPGWRSVIHFTASGRNAGHYGDRIPAVYFYGSKISIASAVSGNLNYYVYSKPVKANKWYTVVIKQTKEGDGKYWYSNTVDGTKVTRVVNTDPRRFEDVKVYAGDPWYIPLAGKIRNLSVTVG